MKISSDLHLHTHCSCDSANATLPYILESGRKLGLKHIGISDHLHTAFNMPDIEIARKEFLEMGKIPNFHFGLEITCATRWECEKIAKRDFASCFTYNLKGHPFQTMTPIDGIMFGGPAGGPLYLDITQEDIDRLGIEYIIGGVHKPNYTEMAPKPMIDDFFNQTCFMLNTPFIDILAHPWDGLEFWSTDYLITKKTADINFDVYYMIPQEYWDEVGHLLAVNHKLAEFNGGFYAMVKHPEKVVHFFMEKMCEWREKGVKFSYGSDLHSEPMDGFKMSKTEKILTEYGFTEDDFALPPRLKNS
ncbi:MAG: hypothetical protein J6W81_05155 [Lentisphaeria bacterium]|nr:hypothetical protein [Lentisphaeria bacterium]